MPRNLSKKCHQQLRWSSEFHLKQVQRLYAAFLKDGIAGLVSEQRESQFTPSWGVPLSLLYNSWSGAFCLPSLKDHDL